MNKISDCLEGYHDLIEIHRVYYGYNEEQVVRWCRLCGSVVVDIEIDGRIMPGGVIKMKAPESYKWIRKEVI